MAFGRTSFVILSSFRKLRRLCVEKKTVPVEWGALLNTMEKSGSLTELLNRVEWSVTRRAVVEYGGDKSRAV